MYKLLNVPTLALDSIYVAYFSQKVFCVLNDHCFVKQLNQILIYKNGFFIIKMALFVFWAGTWVAIS